MMNKVDNKKKVVEFIKTSKPRSVGHKLISQDDFLDGVVVKIEYSDNEENITQWVIVTNKHINYADTESQLIQQMNVATNNFTNKWTWLNQVFNIGGIIALVLVGTASYLSLSTPNVDIPEYLKATLLTVIGFYFGGYVSQEVGKKNKENG